MSHLGSGEFGLVSKGIWHSSTGPEEVAIKMLKDTAKEIERVKFLQEAAIMGQFHHPNVIALYGVVTVGEPVNNATCMLSLSAPMANCITYFCNC